jgi:DNA/RNA endonuclease G (NUC1)
MRLLLSIWIFFLGVLQVEAVIDISLQMQLGNPSNASADTNNHDHYLIQRPVEAIDYSDHLGEPNWASWDLTTNDVGPVDRSDSFFTDTNLPADFYKVTPDDYDGVGNIGFARGHLCPSEDRTDTTNDNKMVFYMSNIMPQDAINNSGVWGAFESYCRSLARTNELLIICGPVGFSGARLNTNGPVFLPSFVWKVAVVVPPGTGTAAGRITNSTRVIALEIPNTDAATNLWPQYVTSARQIEIDTGLTFFTALPTNVATALRNKVDGRLAGTLVGWDMSGLTGGAGNYGPSPLAPTTNDPDLSVVGLTRGSGIVTTGMAATMAWGGLNFTNATAAAAIAANKGITFSVTAKTNCQINFTAVSQFNYKRSGTGPTNGVLQYQLGFGPFSDIATVTYSGTSGAVTPVDLSGIANLQSVGAGTNVTFRLVNYGASGATGSWYINNAGSAANDLELQGTVQPSGIPQLTIQSVNATVILSWPAVYGSYVLQENDDLSSPNWTASSFTVSTNNATISATIPTLSGAHFFRLSQF